MRLNLNAKKLVNRKNKGYLESPFRKKIKKNEFNSKFWLYFVK